MKVEQFVMAYGIEQDRVRAILPEGFESLRPVLRVNAEIRDDKIGYLEFNAPAEKDGKRGWINIGNWHNVEFDKCALQIGDAGGISTVFRLPNLEIMFTRVGIQGGCPAEKDNQGCFFLNEDLDFDDIGQKVCEPEHCRETVRKYQQSGAWIFREAEVITSNKEFCDCEFKWNFDGKGACGKSVGETIPAFLEEAVHHYPRQEFTVENAAIIPCVNEKILGAYVVEFER